MKVLHVVPNVSEEASGPSYSVPSLARALGRQGLEVELFSVLGSALPSSRGFAHRVYPRARLLPRLWRSPALAQALAGAVKGSDVLHSHSLWVMPNIYPGWIRRPNTTELVVSPRGTLSNWALQHSRWKKRAVWTLLQGRVVQTAACLHATAEEEYLDLRRFGLRQPVCVIPNGVDVPERSALEVWQRSALDVRERSALDAAEPSLLDIPVQHCETNLVLYIGRLHVKKGIDSLIRAWTSVAWERPDWSLCIAGPDDGGHERELRALARSLRAPRVTFAGPVYGEAKRALYRHAALHVLPSHSENFGMTVAESLSCGTPVITTHGTPWSGLKREACGWWIECGVDPLVEALRNATALDRAELLRLGARGRRWMQRDFSWDSVGREMSAVYRWLRVGGAPPPTIRID